MVRKLKKKTFSILEIGDADTGTLFEILEPHGLEDPNDIVDVEYLNDGEKIRFKFYVESEDENED